MAGPGQRLNRLVLLELRRDEMHMPRGSDERIMVAKYHIGTSGWQYTHWNKRFYPDDIPKSRWLEFYAREFSTVEVNGTFYGPIKKNTFEKWHGCVPHDFKFSLKGSRWVTHMKKLSGVEDAVKRFYRNAGPLKRKLGCILWQLPPILRKDLDRLSSFCKVLDGRKNNIIEFRHASWFDKETYGVLKENGIGFCAVSAPGVPGAIEKTSDIVYARFHGKRRWYSSLYSEKDIKEWADRIRKKRAKHAYCYFDNDFNANAVRNARMMEGELNA